MSKPFDPIAIVSMACRFPKLDNINELWAALCTRFNAADTVPPDRWDADRYHSHNEASRGKAYVRKGGFVNQDVRTFDASFFGISPREAENMDPQQRLILEVVWEAFENCGLQVPDYAGRNVGVYVGGFMLDHMITQMGLGNRSSINQHSAAGMMMTMLSNRVSHTFDFRGPSLSIDTACSSSLVSFHYACQDVWRGACEMAVVGGTNVMMRPEYPIGMSKGHFLARDGESKSFDTRGDGYGRGEGAGVLLLKPLQKALSDGDTILSLVTGSGTNQDGRTPGISMPNGESQQALIEEVCQQYGVEPLTVDYVECHGTGTGIGDPTEAQAIGATYGKNRNGNPVVIGSVKSNIGHLEAAAGVAGVIKAVLNVMHRTATPLGNLQTPRDDISFKDLGIRLSDDLIMIGNEDQPVRAAVNSFGYGGSNAHVLLQSAPTPPALIPFKLNGEQPADDRPNGDAHQNAPEKNESEMPYALPVSGRSKEALIANAAAIANWMTSSHESLEDIIYTASKRRTHHNHRAVAMGRTRNEVINSLQSIANRSENEMIVRDVQPFQGLRKPVFVFTGMGPQWWYMGQELYKSQPVYREFVERADAAFEKVSGFSILAEMLLPEEKSNIQKTAYAQPANLLIQIGVYEMLKSQGITPGLVVGHSVGELGSAYAAGVLSLEDAMLVSFHRSQLQAETAGQGGMLAIGLGKQAALEKIADCSKLVSLAAVNGPTSVTLAGYTNSLKRIEAELTEEGVFAKMLAVEIPYHSPMMDPLMPRLAKALAAVQTNKPTLPIYSTVTGDLVTEPSFGADYWPLNIRNPVEFEDAIRAILDLGYNTFVEIGPHPVLAASLRDCIKVVGKDCRLIHTLRRNLPNETLNIHRAVMSIFAAGCDFDWSPFNTSENFVQLPNYQWQRERFWIENDRAAQDRINPVIHPILGTQEALASAVWRNDFDHQAMNYLRDHIVSGLPILPAAGYLESLLEVAAIQFPDAKGLAIRDLEIMAPLILAEDRGIDFTTTYDPRNHSTIIRSQENGRLGAAQIHVAARIAEIKHAAPVKIELAKYQSDGDESDSIEKFYQKLHQIGLMYAPMFQTVKKLYLHRELRSVLAKIELDPSLEEHLPKYKLHPTMLDGCFQTLMAMLGDSETTYLPTHIGELRYYAESASKSLWCVGKLVSQTARVLTCDLTLADDEGNVIAVVRGLKATAASKPERTDKWGDNVKLQIMNYVWEHGETLAEPKRLGHWMTVGQANDASDFITGRLESYGATVVGKVRYGGEFSQSGQESTIRFDSVEDAKQAVTNAGQLNGVVFFNGVDETLREGCPTAEKAFNALLTFTQALLEIPVDQRPRVYVATQTAFQIDENDTDIDPGSSTLNGFCRVAANELEGFKFTTIDMSADLEDEDMLEAFVLELICDADEDEVALREDSRMVSELLENKTLTDDVVVPTHLDDDHPVWVRPLRSDVESVGMVRVLAAPVVKPAPNEIRIRVESSLLPFSLILDQASDQIEQPCIEIVGRVIEVGSDVSDLKIGMRVCGLAPSELASHMCGDRNDFYLVPISDDDNASNLVGGITLPICATRAVSVHELEPGDTALVFESPMGLAVAKTLASKGVNVSLVSNRPNEIDSDVKGLFPIYAACPEAIEQAITEQTADRGFAGLVVGLKDWSTDFDFRSLADGGWVIDTDEQAARVQLPTNVGSVSRTSMATILRKQKKLESVLGDVICQIIDGTEEGAPTLDVSIADIAWQALPLTETKTRVVIEYDTRGKDLPVVQSDELQFKANATYLITGGFGGFGSKTAEWLVKNGARNIVLTGRSGANTPEKQAIVAHLESLGAFLKAAVCDTSNPAAVATLFAEIAETMPPLKGVFHSGAVIMDQAVGESDLETVNTVMRSKATGAYNLHVQTEKMELDHFVLYSSLANLIGNSRQGAYCAANGYLNGLAQMRHAKGLPATSVNWGAIAEVGVVAQDEKLEQFLKHLGLRGITTEEGLGLLSLGLARSVPQFGVVLIKSWADWARFESIGSSLPRFRTIVETDSAPKDNGIREQLVAEMAPLSSGDRSELMAQLIQQIVASVLKSAPESIELDRPINELGIDSLMATEIQILFESNLGLAISVLELIGDTTIRSLANSSLESLEADFQKGPQDSTSETKKVPQSPTSPLVTTP
ncbi:MAG: SDR family NAD(P)-dependent oxidoreductase [Mariniblastus sp.]